MTALVDEFAYVVLDTADVQAWARFAEDVIAAEVLCDGPTVRLRLDSRPFRYLIRQSETDRLPVLGWQVADAATLSLVSARVSGLGLNLVPLDAPELLERQAEGGMRFNCHNGISHEVAYGLTASGQFVPPGDVTGFVTSPGGLGHTVWAIRDLAEMDRLMIGGFGMALRENISTPSGTGHFYGCNPRHHSLAVFTASALQVEHLMAEMGELDDVGRAMDRALDGGYSILKPLGRHRTDHMVSFYVQTPSGFGMEIGCGGVMCGDNWNEVRESNRRRPWGHDQAMRMHQKQFAASKSQQRQGKA